VKDDYATAITNYDEAIQRDGNNGGIYYHRGVCYQVKGDNDKAVKDFTEAIRLIPNLTPAYEGRGTAYNGKGEYDKAVADYSEAIQLEPKRALSWNGLAWLYATCPQANLRDGKKAVEHAKQACGLSEWKDPNMVDTLAAAYAENGDYEQAVKWATKYLETPNLSAKETPGAKSRLALYQGHKPYHRDK